MLPGFKWCFYFRSIDCYRNVRINQPYDFDLYGQEASNSRHHEENDPYRPRFYRGRHILYWQRMNSKTGLLFVLCSP